MTDFVFEEKSLYIGIPLEARVVAELSQKKLTLFTAESCTGGLVSKLITDISGASRVLLGGIVSYTNEVKMNQLGVSPKTIAEFSEVSAECAAEMAEGAREISGADIGVSATGYASDGEGVPKGMKGTVFIGYSDKNGVKIRKLKLCGSRDEVRNIAAQNIFDMILGEVPERIICQ